MVPAGSVLDAAREHGFDFIAGVGDTLLGPLRDEALVRPHEVRFVTTAMSCESVEVAAGAALGGRTAAILCCSTTVGGALTPLATLAGSYRIPMLLVVGWRGQPGSGDAPHHEPLGSRIEALLEAFDVPSRRLPRDPRELPAAFAAARFRMDRDRLPYALLVERGVLGEGRRPDETPGRSAAGAWHDLRRHISRPSQSELLEAFLDRVPPSVAVIAPTGHCGRELYRLGDREQHFYLPGSTGCGPGVGLGVAVASSRRVVTIDGDGSAVRRLGGLATIGRERPRNLIHLLIDNAEADVVDFPAVALACGYAGAYACDDMPGFRVALDKALRRQGPALIHARVRADVESVAPRPDLTPSEIAERFTAFLNRRLAA